MNVGNTVFSQLMSLIPDYELRKCIDRYRGDFHARRFQLTAFNSRLYHAGLKVMPKSTLADMNEKKDCLSYQPYSSLAHECTTEQPRSRVIAA